MSRLLTACLGAALCLGWLLPCAAAQYPERGVRLIVPYPAGQTTDVIGREIGQQMAQELGQPFYVDNRAGAGGIIGMEAGKRAEADGYTLLVTASGPVGINPGLYDSLPYDVERDYEPVGLIAMVPLFLVVRSDFPADDVQGLIEHVRRHPGQLNYGSGGSGLTNHLTMEIFKSRTDLNMMHVPYRGATAALTGLIGGDVAVMFEAGPAIMPHVQSGALKILGVSTQEPSRAFPDAPPIGQAGVPGFAAQAWIVMLAPARTPAPVIERLNATLAKVLAQPAVQRKLSALGAETVSYTPAQTRAFIREEIGVWTRAVRLSNAKPG
ncbi:tripartite tricarboxylate transporter substrate binding protein [Orrella sp. JC864]|uniref:Bug family tripartite tricarboxylate transporter substrate binding protein n=1 Tax=Orrella sp. JC864 TaxID=3120298 RepID=UPI00300B79A0